MKILKTIGLFLLSILCFITMFVFEIKTWPVGSSFAGIVLGFTFTGFCHSIQDLSDTTDWKVSQRNLKRGRFISNETIIRISFAYLYRIKVGNKYLLVKNERGTKKYQPVGGVYKLKGNEKIELKNLYHIIDDNKVSIDESSCNDYRLQMESKYLRKFVKRFDRKAERERVDDLSREFTEELVEKGIVNWGKITYRFCGRYMTNLHFGEHFQIYELLLADIVELLPTVEQENDLRQLMAQDSDLYRFATAEEINSLGVNTETEELEESIGDHTKKTIQEYEGQLIRTRDFGKAYTVDLHT